MQELSKDHALEIIKILGLYKAEWLNESFFELFNEPAYFGELKTNRPCVLIGGRGTGKTTVLRGLSYQGQLALSSSNQSKITEWNYYGLYYRVNLNRITAFRGPEVPDHRWSEYFAHYINLLFCQMLLEFVHWYEKQTNVEIKIDAKSLRKIEKTLGIRECENLSELYERLELATHEFEASINTIADNPSKFVSMQAAPIDALTATLGKTPEFAGKQFFFLIDEFENFEDYQQRVLNTLIKHSNSNYTFKIGVKELGWRERATLNSHEVLTSPADYARINISEALTQQRFKPFAENIITNRFAKVNPAWAQSLRNISHIFSEFSELEEANILLEKSFHKELVESIRLKLSPENAERIQDLNPGILAFLNYWGSEKHELTFEECVSQYLNDPSSWKTRIENHFYAFLFSIRKGKRGIRKYYCGWDVYISLANGNIRYLLELVHAAFLKHIEEKNGIDLPISCAVQTHAASDIGRKNLSELEGLSVNGARLAKLLLSLGRVFQVLAESPSGHAPEVNQFQLSSKDGDLSLQNDCQEILNQSVMHLALVRSPGNKLEDESDTKAYDYMIHPIYAPFFGFSHRKKRKLTLDHSQITRLIESPRETIREILLRNNRDDLDNLPDQLQLFGSYYAENQ